MKLLIVMLGLLGLAQACWARSSVWEASKGDHTLLIGGTMHLLRPGDLPLPPEYEAALQRASRVVFETDMEAIAAPTFARTLADSMRASPEDGASHALSPEVRGEVERFAARRGLEAESLLAFDPGYLALTLTLQGYRAQGFTIATDQRLYAQAKAERKTIAALESTDEQLGALTSMNEVDPDQLIRQTLKDIATLESDADTMVKALRGGDLTTLTRLSNEMRSEYPDVYATLLAQRNARWLPELEAMLADGTPTFVLVGALHLAGPDSVLEKLKARGYRVRYFTP